MAYVPRRGRARGDFLGGSDVDDLEAARAASDSEGSAISMSASSRRNPEMCAHPGARHSARRAALSLRLEKFMKSSSKQFPCELTGHTQENLDGEQSLQCAECAGYGAQNSRFRAIADHAIGVRVGPETAQAGVVRLRLVHLQLTLELVDAGEHCGPVREHRGIVDQELGAEVVAAVDHDVIAADQCSALSALSRTA